MKPSLRRKLAKVEAKSFVFDGCHKIFLCLDAEEEKIAFERGWKRSDLRPFDPKEVERLFNLSCPLRAVWWFADRPAVIEQGE